MSPKDRTPRRRSEARGNLPEPYLTPPEIARLLRVTTDKVLGWIRRAELRAVNVSDRSRAQYRVGRADLDAFLAAREVRPPAPRPRVRRSERPPEGGPIDPELGERLLRKKQAVKRGDSYYRVRDGIPQFV